MKKLFLLCMTVCLLFSCGNHNGTKVSYLAFKVDEKDRWGLIDQNGNILFENEFQVKPVAVFNDRFFVKNNKGLYECYTTEKKPRKVGKEYVSILPFVEDITPVAEKDQPISFIDKNGKTVFTFSKFENKTVMAITNFSEGLAVFQTEDELFGYVDTKGKVVIKPLYKEAFGFSENIALVTDKDGKRFAIDHKGQKLFDLKSSQLFINQSYHNDMLIYYTEDNFEPGCLNRKGEKVILPSSKFSTIGLFEGEVAAVREGEYWGFINKKGDLLIRAKYQNVGFYNSEFACVQDKDKIGIIDYNGETLCDFKYDEILPFYNGKYAYAKSHNYYTLIDKTGKEINKKEYAIIEDYSRLTDFIESDYLDYEAVLRKDLNIGINGVDGVDFSDTPEIVFNRKNELYSKEDYRNNEYIFYKKETKYFEVTFVVQYPEKVVTPITEKVNYGWGFYDEKIKGYNFNNNQDVAVIVMYIAGKDKAYKKYVNIISAIEKNFVSLGFKAEKKGEGFPVKLTYKDEARVIIHKDDDDDTRIRVSYTGNHNTIRDDFWERIKDENYSIYTGRAYNATRATADSIRIADSIAAVEVAANYD